MGEATYKPLPIKGQPRPLKKQSAKGMQKRNPGAFDKKGQLKVGATIKYAHGTKSYKVKKGDTADNVAARIRTGTENVDFSQIGKKRGHPSSPGTGGGSPPVFEARPKPGTVIIGQNPGGPRMGGPRSTTNPPRASNPINETIGPGFGKPKNGSGSEPRYQVFADKARSGKAPARAAAPRKGVKKLR